MVPVSSTFAKENNVRQNILEKELSNDDISIDATNIGRIVLKAAFKIISKYGDFFYHRTPTVSYGPSRDTASSGEIHFNNKYNRGYGAAVDKEIQGVKAGHQIERWANSGQLLWGGKISVILRDPNGVKRINRTVGHNQYSWYSIPIGNTGKYLAEYVSNSKHTWNLWIAYYHFGDFVDYPCDGSGNCYNSTPNTLTTVNQYGKEVQFKKIGNKRFIVPSKNHVQLNSENYNKKIINFNEFHNQFFDEELNSYVDVAKNYIVGDVIRVRDTIKALEYDKKEDATYFWFEFSDNKVDYVKFSGDLTNKFKMGDQLEFKFKLFPATKDNKYVILNYNYEVENTGKTPNIDGYLVKSNFVTTEGEFNE